MSCVNNELATQMQDVISNISALPAESAAGLNAILQTLMAALGGSTGSMLTNSGGGASQTVQGTFVVLYGTIEADNYALISSRSTVRIVGSDAHITGDLRPANIQADTTTVKIDFFKEPILFAVGSSWRRDYRGERNIWRPANK